jgi:hypothetical protein
MIEQLLPVFCAQLGIPFNRIFYLGIGKVLLFAERLGLDVGGGNALFDQKTFGAVDAPLRKRLIVFHGSALVAMALKSQAGIRFALEISLEITCECSESLFLAGKQTAVRILARRLVRRKINTPDGQSLLDRDNLRCGSLYLRRRWWWWWGACTSTAAVEEAVSGGLRSSLTLQVTVIVPGCAPVLSRVAVEVLPVMLPALAA